MTTTTIYVHSPISTFVSGSNVSHPLRARIVTRTRNQLSVIFIQVTHAINTQSLMQQFPFSTMPLSTLIMMMIVSEYHIPIHSISWHASSQTVEGLECVPNLTSLSLKSNMIARIEHLGHLQHLTELNLADNFIVALDGLDKLSALTSLNVEGNRIAVCLLGVLASLWELIFSIWIESREFFLLYYVHN